METMLGAFWEVIARSGVNGGRTRTSPRSGAAYKATARNRKRRNSRSTAHKRSRMSSRNPVRNCTPAHGDTPEYRRRNSPKFGQSPNRSIARKQMLIRAAWLSQFSLHPECIFVTQSPNYNSDCAISVPARGEYGARSLSVWPRAPRPRFAPHRVNQNKAYNLHYIKGKKRPREAGPRSQQAPLDRRSFQPFRARKGKYLPTGVRQGPFARTRNLSSFDRVFDYWQLARLREWVISPRITESLGMRPVCWSCCGIFYF